MFFTFIEYWVNSLVRTLRSIFGRCPDCGGKIFQFSFRQKDCLKCGKKWGTGL